MTRPTEISCQGPSLDSEGDGSNSRREPVGSGRDRYSTCREQHFHEEPVYLRIGVGACVSERRHLVVEISCGVHRCRHHGRARYATDNDSVDSFATQHHVQICAGKSAGAAFENHRIGRIDGECVDDRSVLGCVVSDLTHRVEVLHHRVVGMDIGSVGPKPGAQVHDVSTYAPRQRNSFCEHGDHRSGERELPNDSGLDISDDQRCPLLSARVRHSLSALSVATSPLLTAMPSPRTPSASARRPTVKRMIRPTTITAAMVSRA